MSQKANGAKWDLYFLIGFLATTTLSVYVGVVNALPSEDEIMAKIDREAERINDIIDQKIQNHPGLSDFDGYCYNSVEALELCQNEIVNEMDPYYEEAGERIWDNID